MDNRDSSGVNTILIVIVLILVVVALVWFMRGGFQEDVIPENDNNQIDVNLPDVTPIEDETEGDGTSVPQI